MRKVKSFVRYPSELSLSNFVSDSEYELFAVLIHEGFSLNSGHYYSYIKNKDKWYLMNDSSVSPSNESTVLSQKPYILFYQKKVSSKGLFPMVVRPKDDSMKHKKQLNSQEKDTRQQAVTIDTKDNCVKNQVEKSKNINDNKSKHTLASLTKSDPINPMKVIEIDLRNSNENINNNSSESNFHIDLELNEQDNNHPNDKHFKPINGISIKDSKLETKTNKQIIREIILRKRNSFKNMIDEQKRIQLQKKQDKFRVEINEAELDSILVMSQENQKIQEKLLSDNIIKEEKREIAIKHPVPVQLTNEKTANGLSSYSNTFKQPVQKNCSQRFNKSINSELFNGKRVSAWESDSDSIDDKREEITFNQQNKFISANKDSFQKPKLNYKDKYDVEYDSGKLKKVKEKKEASRERNQFQRMEKKFHVNGNGVVEESYRKPKKNDTYQKRNVNKENGHY